MAQKPLLGRGLLGFNVSWSHSTPWSVGRVISPTHSLLRTIHNTRDRQIFPRRDSNPQSQQASGRRPTP